MNENSFLKIILVFSFLLFCRTVNGQTDSWANHTVQWDPKGTCPTCNRRIRQTISEKNGVLSVVQESDKIAFYNRDTNGYDVMPGIELVRVRLSDLKGEFNTTKMYRSTQIVLSVVASGVAVGLWRCKPNQKNCGEGLNTGVSESVFELYFADGVIANEAVLNIKKLMNSR